MKCKVYQSSQYRDFGGVLLGFLVNRQIPSLTSSVHLPEVERQFVLTKQQWQEKKSVAYELEKEKHVLRQMQGKVDI